MLENICAEYGLSKADQSNTAMDEYGGRRRFTTEADGLAPLAPLALAPLAPQLAAPAPHGPAPHGLASHAVLCCTALAPARQHGHRQLQGRLQPNPILTQALTQPGNMAIGNFKAGSKSAGDSAYGARQAAR